jgi:hypothetical protein
MRDDLLCRLKLAAPIAWASQGDFAERLLEALCSDPDQFPADDYCTSGGAGQDVAILAVEIMAFGKTEVTGLLRVAFTEKYQVGCADIRHEEKHHVASRFWYRAGEALLEVERGYRKREYEREEF